MMRRKIYYGPGLLSLVGIPIFIFLVYPHPILSQTCLKFFLPSDKPPTRLSNPFSKYSIYQEIKQEKLMVISLNDLNIHQNKFLLNSKLDFITWELELMTFTHYTTVAIQIDLGDQNTFGDFVWLVNRAQLYGFRRYALADDHFIFLPERSQSDLNNKKLNNLEQ